MNMSGWKTWAGGLGLIAVGLVMIVNKEFEAGAMKIAEGLAIIGIGHKIEKSQAAN